MSQQPPGPPPGQPPGQPMPPAQQPYQASGSPTTGLITEAWNLYIGNLARLVPIAFIIYAIVSLITLALVAIGGLIGAIASIPVAIIGVFLVQASLVRAVEDLRDGTADLSIGATMSSVTARLGPVIVAGIVAGIAIAVGLVLLIIPGVILLTIWAVVVPVIVVENRGAFEAMSRSQELVKGHFMNVLGVIALAFLILFGFGIVLGLILSPLPDVAEAYIGDVISGSITAPFTAAVTTLLYFRLSGAKGGSAPQVP